MSFKWDNKTVLDLIKKIHENESLWDREHPDYRDRGKRAAGLRAVARALGTLRDEVERKFKNVTSHYYRERKRHKKRMAAEGPGVAEPRWFAYHAMSFLPDKLRKDRSQTGSPLFAPPLAICSEDPDPPPPPRAFINPPTRGKGAARDEAAVFGEYVAFKIRRMEPATMAVVQHRIHNIIYEAESRSAPRAPIVPDKMKRASKKDKSPFRPPRSSPETIGSDSD